MGCVEPLAMAAGNGCQSCCAHEDAPLGWAHAVNLGIAVPTKKLSTNMQSDFSRLTFVALKGALGW